MSRVLIVGATSPMTGPAVRGLRDAGHEVVVVAEGPPEAIASAAVQEDVDAVVVAAGAPEHRAALQAVGAHDVPVHAIDEGASVDSIVDHLN